MRPIQRYLLFQVPGWLTLAGVMGFLHVSAAVSTSMALGVIGLFIALDFLLYPFFRHSYASRAQAGPETLVGRKVRVVEPLAPEGVVRIHAERWRARMLEASQSAAPGETVEVAGIDGLTLLVRPLP